MPTDTKPPVFIPTSAMKGLLPDPNLSPSQVKNLQLLKSGLFADFEIVVGKKTWKVLDTYTISNWDIMLTERKEAKDKRVKLTESDFKDGEMDFILDFMYAGDRAFSIEKPPRSGLESCVRLYAHAEYLLIPALKDMAVQAMQQIRPAPPPCNVPGN